MTDRPILFSGSMVRALMEGRKTMTRRVLKPQPDWIESSGRWSWPIPESKRVACTFVCTASREWHEYLLPHQLPYAPGDRLWVRETFRGARGYDNVWPRDFGNKPIWYEADGLPIGDEWGFLSHIRRPSTQMPRWASRITLLVDDVRVQRVQDISADDAWDEGVNRHSSKVRQFWLYGADQEKREAIYKRACVWEFKDLWNSLNAKRGFGWDANPWVVALTFRVVQANIDKLEDAA